MTQELIERLEPCPFCGESDGEETALYVTWDTRQGRTVLCNACGAYGPSCPGPNEAEAIAAWNTRDQSQAARIAELEARQHGGDHGAAGDAVDFACDHCGPDEALAFLEDWRFGQTSEWPAYLKWLAVQRAGAAEARASLETDDAKR